MSKELRLARAELDAVRQQLEETSPTAHPQKRFVERLVAERDRLEAALDTERETVAQLRDEVSSKRKELLFAGLRCEACGSASGLSPPPPSDTLSPPQPTLGARSPETLGSPPSHVLPEPRVVLSPSLVSPAGVRFVVGHP